MEVQARDGMGVPRQLTQLLICHKIPDLLWEQQQVNQIEIKHIYY